MLQPILGITLVPHPDFVPILVCDAQGSAQFTLPIPPGLQAGLPILAQAVLLDSGAAAGLVATRAVADSVR